VIFGLYVRYYPRIVAYFCVLLAVFAGWETAITVTLVGDLGGQTMQLHEALGRGLVESITSVVGGQGEVIQRLWRTTAVDDDLTSLQYQADIAGDVFLGLGDESIQRTLQWRVPQAVVDLFGPASIRQTLVACQFALHGDIFERF